MGELRAALKDIDRTLEFNLPFADAYNNRGSVRHINDPKGAASDYSSAVRQARRRSLE
jgi:hypothetical protein